MIKEAKNLLEGIIKATTPDVTVVKSVADETHAIMARKFPLAALITNPGSFDDSWARTVRFFKDGKYKERYVRGIRNLPILIRCWEIGEDKADGLSSIIIPEIPSQWEYEGFTSHVQIRSEEHSDHANSLNKPYCTVIEVVFEGYAARKSEEAPYFDRTGLEAGDFA